MKLPIPITVLTGFLGSGKTTILKRILADPAMAGTVVIVNEFGDVGLDDQLIEAAEEETVLLPSGCACCAVRGDLVEALKRLADKGLSGAIDPLNRIVIETTGLADPAPIAQTLMTEEDLFRFFQLDGIVTTVDGELAAEQLKTQFEPAKQIAVADVVLITKTDRTDAGALAALEADVRALNATAPIHRVAHGAVALEWLTGLRAFEPIAVKDHADAWLGDHAHAPAATACQDPDCSDPSHRHAHAHDDNPSQPHTSEHRAGHLHGVTSFALTFDEPLDGRKLSFAIELLRSTHGDRLLRVKGIVAIAGEPNPFVIHGVQHVFYPPAPLDAAPPGGTTSRIVFITRGLSEADVRAVLAPLFDPAQPDYASGWTAGS